MLKIKAQIRGSHPSSSARMPKKITKLLVIHEGELALRYSRIKHLFERQA